MYTLHIANKNYSSWSLRPWVLMTCLNIPFEESISPFQSGSNWQSFRNFSPTGLVPCLVDQSVEGEPTVVWDSLAIIEYLAEQHSGVWPDNLMARTWARSATAEMHSGFSALRNQCPMSCGIRVAMTIQTEALQKDLARIDELWTQGLSMFGGEFLAGDQFTAVDAFYVPVAFRIRSYGLVLSESSMAYVGRLLALPSVKQWEQDALAETWREEAHEQEAEQFGTITHDLRAQ